MPAPPTSQLAQLRPDKAMQMDPMAFSAVDVQTTGVALIARSEANMVWQDSCSLATIDYGDSGIHVSPTWSISLLPGRN